MASLRADRIPDMRRPWGGAAAAPAFAGLAVAAVIALLGVSALASRDPLSGLQNAGEAPPVLATPHATATPWVLTLIGGLATLGLLGVLAHVHGGTPRAPQPTRALRLLGFAVFVVLLLIVAALVKVALDAAHQHHRPHGRGPVVPKAPGSARGATPLFVLPSWLSVAVLALVIAGAVLAVRAISRYRRRIAAEPAQSAIADAVEFSREELRVAPDSRRAVIAAYARMEAALADAGLPRSVVEAPREYLTRVLASLEVSSGPIRRLTNLFERARFSSHRIDPALRDEALDALDEIQAELKPA